MPSSPEVIVSNLPPVWTFYVIAIAQLCFGVATLAIAVVLIKLLGQVATVLKDVNDMTNEISKKVPSMMTNVDATMGNVKAMSDDARVTTHNVTGAVNRVSHIVGSVAGKLESPLVKGVGALTGVAAGLNALRGNKREVVVEVPRKRGFLGRKK
jgi:uncharacterized protein YoxC